MYSKTNILFLIFLIIFYYKKCLLKTAIIILLQILQIILKYFLNNKILYTKSSTIQKRKINRLNLYIQDIIHNQQNLSYQDQIQLIK